VTRLAILLAEAACAPDAERDDDGR
jgi:hypothetical protein